MKRRWIADSLDRKIKKFQKVIGETTMRKDFTFLKASHIIGENIELRNFNNGKRFPIVAILPIEKKRPGRRRKELWP